MAPNDPHSRRAWRTEEQWQQLRARIDAGADAGEDAVDGVEPAAPRIRWATWAGAAAAAIVVLTASGLILRARPARAEMHVATTSSGQRKVIHLADSTVITLGPASTLRYTVGGTTRDVELDGMAAFRVVHDSTRPFIVRAGGAEATDLGTEFVVRAYGDDSTVRVAVTAGSVALVNRTNAANTLTLRAGDVGIVRGQDAPAPVEHTTAAAYATWVDGHLDFDDVPLAIVAADLGRWFDADIRIADPALARRRVSATYNDATLTGVLDALALAKHFEYTRAGRTFTLRPRAR